ncbi:MAG: histidine phosphatase family protein [Shimia sp.]
MRLYAMRHGETEWNAEGRLQGGRDSPLTARGRGQSRALGAILRREGLSDAPLFAAPAGRVLATCALALPGAVPTIRPALAEAGIGAWEGRLRAEVAQGGDALRLYDAAPGGEGMAAVLARVGRAVAALPTGALVVTHGVTLAALRAHVTGRPLATLADPTGRQGVIYALAPGTETVLE